VSIYRKKVEPVLLTAGCTMDVTRENVFRVSAFPPFLCSPNYLIDTTHSGHAKEIAQSLPLDYDALLVLSGDGLVHEVFNGFAEHERPLQAFSTPIVQIPTGSANGLSLNILGLQVQSAPF
jgi:sphingosine kinase